MSVGVGVRLVLIYLDAFLWNIALIDYDARQPDRMGKVPANGHESRHAERGFRIAY